MDISINGLGLGITDRFRSYATEKAEKIAHLADEKVFAFEVKVTRHNEKNGSTGDDRVELTLIGSGPLVRAESTGSDKYVALDLAIPLRGIEFGKPRPKCGELGGGEPLNSFLDFL